MIASENGTSGATTPGQVRAARALLGWSQQHLAEVSGVPKRTVVRLEGGHTAPRAGTLSHVRDALELAGVEFIERNGGGPGVRLRKA
jgi:transcriptional regulator with XRE-family HTH domain